MSRADALRRLADDPSASEAEREAARRVLAREGGPDAHSWVSTSSPLREQLVMYAARHHGALVRLEVTPTGRSRRGFMVVGTTEAVDATVDAVRRLGPDVDRIALEAVVGFLSGALPVTAAGGERIVSGDVVSAAFVAGAATHPPVSPPMLEAT